MKIGGCTRPYLEIMDQPAAISLTNLDEDWCGAQKTRQNEWAGLRNGVSCYLFSFEQPAGSEERMQRGGFPRGR
jgi:hypothetical protein